MALWFAVEGASKGNDDANATVWVLDSNSSDIVGAEEKGRSPFELSRTKFFEPEHIDRRIAAQSSVFSVHRRWSKKDKFVALENQASFRDRLRKISVKKGREDTILQELQTCGVHYASVFPDLQGLGRFLSYRHGIVHMAFEVDEIVRSIRDDLNGLPSASSSKFNRGPRTRQARS